MKTKICTKCHEEKELSEFTFRKDSQKYRNHCKLCRSKKQSEYFELNKEKHYASIKQYYIDNPWMQSFRAIQYRCTNVNAIDYKYYGGRGIKNLLTKEEIKFLWFRDKAYNLEQPTIDRKDNDGNYELSNCEFIEQSENSKKRNKLKGE